MALGRSDRAASRRGSCLHIISSTHDAGAENQAFYLMRALRALDRFDVELAFHREGRKHRAFVELGVRCHQIERRDPSAEDLERRARSVWRIYRDEQPALIHTWLFTANMLGHRAAQRWPSAALIVSQHAGTMEREMPERLQGMKLLGSRADEAIATSPEGAALLRDNGFDPARVTVIPNGIPEDRVRVLEPRERVRARLGIGTRVPVIAYVGRVHYSKDLRNLFAAMRVVNDRIPEAVLLMVGPSAQELVDAGLPPLRSAVPVGWHAHPADLMNCADALAISSITEGYPNVAGEALSLGLPVATTATGGHLEVVREAGGKVVPLRSPGALGNALLSLLAHPPTRGQVAGVARQRLNYDAVVRATLDVYERAMARAATRAAGFRSRL